MLRVIICTVTGAACGALAGGVLVALTVVAAEPTDGSHFFGGSKWDWAQLGFLTGMVPGSLAGVVTGLAVGLAGAGRRAGLIIGAIVGVAAATILFGEGAASDTGWTVWVVLSPPLCALIGLTVSAAGRLLPSSS